MRAVSVKTAKRHVTIFRAYDKGIESGSHPAGERIRFEAQNRVPSTTRATAESLAITDLQHNFGRSLEPFMLGSEVTVMSTDSVVEVLARKISEGELTPQVGARLIGDAVLLGTYGRAIYTDDRMSQRRVKALRDAGVAVDDQLPPGSTGAGHPALA